MLRYIPTATCVLGIAAGCVAQSWEWADNDTPVARWMHAAAYDTDRERMVVVGGRGSEGETWEWDSVTGDWSLVARDGPSRRRLAAMVYDRARHVCVYTGGGGDTPSAAEVWEWDGATWTQKPNMPHRRSNHAMAYDAAHGVTILYGGAPNDAHSNKTLIYDGSTWQEVITAFPGVQNGHAMAYDIARDRVVLVESNSGGNMDTYEWSTVDRSWTPIGVFTQPTDRYNPEIVYDEHRHRIVLVGGYGNGNTLEYDGKDWEQVDVGGATGRDHHSLVYDTRRMATLLFGGMSPTINPRRDLRAWDGSSWSVLSDTTSPSPRSIWRGIAFDSHRGVSVVYGGLRVQSDNIVRNNALGGPWLWDGQSWTAGATNQVGTRFRNVLAFDSIRGVTVLHGGRYDSRNGFNELASSTWEFDGSDWTEVVDAAGPALENHAMAFDSRRGQMVIFGGVKPGGEYSGETWVYNGAVWTPIQTPGPTPRIAHMTYDERRGVTVLFGGFDGSAHLADTWEWNGIAWTNRDVPGPTARSGHTMAADRLGHVVMFGGSNTDGNDVVYDDVWVYNGVTWTPLEIDPRPSARTVPGMCFDSWRNTFVLFGGRTNPSDNAFALAQTWELSLPCDADMNGDGNLNLFDFLAFQSAFGNADPAADFNGDGNLNLFDFLAFQSAFGSGC